MKIDPVSMKIGLKIYFNIDPLQPRAEGKERSKG